MKYSNAVFFIPLLIVVCCRPQASTDSDAENYHDSTAEYLERFRAKVDAELNLQPLKNSTDSFELRLSAKIPVYKFHYGQLLVIKKYKTIWRCLEYNYIFRTAPFGSTDEEYFDQYAIDTIWIYKKYPKSGWVKFFEKINNKGIYDLPKRQVIEKALDSLHITLADGVSYRIEFVNGVQYRNEAYNSPQVFVDKIPACRKITNIIKIFDEEFGVADNSDKIIRQLSEEVILHYDTALQRHIREEKNNH
jgi:hypothetical protein